MKKLSIVIVSYNVKDLLRDCLKSVYNTVKNISYDIWVIDNNSQDDSVKMLKKEFPKVNIIANKHNPGFNTANNQGIKKSNSEYILLLNPDTIVYPGAIEEMVRTLDKNSKIGAVGPMILAPDKKSIQYSGARNMTSFFTIFNTTFKLDRLTKDLLPGLLMISWNHKTSRFVDVLSGSCVLFRREPGIVPLDEGFFMYGDDVDLCYQVLKKGYRVFYNTDAKIIHYGGASTDTILDFNRIKMRKKSLHHFFTKNKGPVYAFFTDMLIHVMFSRLFHRYPKQARKRFREFI